MATGYPDRQAIGNWARYLGLGTLATGNPHRQAIGLGTLAQIPWRREILIGTLLAAGLRYLGLGTLATRNPHRQAIGNLA